MQKITIGKRRINLNDYSNEQLKTLIGGLVKKLIELEEENKLLKIPVVKLGNIERNFMEDRIEDEYVQEFPEDYRF